MTKQMHRYVRVCQQFYKQIRRNSPSPSTKKHRNRSWWKAYSRTMRAEWRKGKKDE